jgi:hypothetical protein
MYLRTPHFLHVFGCYLEGENCLLKRVLQFCGMVICNFDLCVQRLNFFP